MKISNKFGILATALAICVAWAPWSANAAGDIRSIDAVDAGFGGEYGPSNPVRVGQKLKFELRLLNVNRAETLADSTKVSPWMPFLNKPGWEGTANLFPIQVGLWMGGHRVWATLESCKLLSEAYASGEASSLTAMMPALSLNYYTSMVFSYEVQPGDIAMPVRFSNPSGTGEIEPGQEISFNNLGPGSMWSVKDFLTGTVDCQFTMGSPLGSADEPWPLGYIVTDAMSYEKLGNRDLSLSGSSGMGFYVQTVDFDSDNNPWRTLSAKGGKTPDEGAPRVIIPGNQATNTTVYIWTEDKDVITVNNGKNETLYTALDPVTRTPKEYLVYALSIAGADSATFNLKAGPDTSEGDSTRIYLSSTPTNVWTSAGVLISNFTSRVVVCGPARTPDIELTLDKTRLACNVNEEFIQLTITPTQAPTNNCTVNLAFTYDTVGGQPVVAADGILGVSTEMDNHYDFNLSVPFTKGMEQRIVYIYGLGFSAKESKTICVKPSVVGDGGFFDSTGMAPVNFLVEEQKPSIVECPGSISAVAGTEYPLVLKIEDSYRNMHGAYKVEWMETSVSSYKQIASDLVPSEDGEIIVNLKYSGEGEKVSRIRVVGVDGNTSGFAEFNADVAGAKTAVLVTNREGEDDYHTFAEGEKISVVKVALKNWRNETGNAVYAFLTPTNTYEETSLASLLSQERCFTTTENARGLKIANGEDLSATTSFSILDNNLYEDPVEFAIEIRTKQAYADPEGEQVLFVSPEDSSFNYINITNCPPAFKSLGIKGGALAINNGKTTGNTLTAEQGVTKTFNWVASDVSADLPTLTTKWSLTTPTGGSETFPAIVGNPAEQAFQYKFKMKGVYTVTVQMYDKDMDPLDEDAMTTFTFDVNVGDAPALGFKFPDDSSDRFKFFEDAVDRGIDGYFRVGPVTPAADDITIKITRKPLSGVTGTFEFYGADAATKTLEVVIPAGVTLDSDPAGYYTRIDLDALDGTQSSGKATGGFELSVEVVSDNVSPDGITYKEYYCPNGPKTVRIFLDNVAPELTAYSEPAPNNPTNHNIDVSANQPITVSWDVSDVTADLAAGLQLKWAGLPSNATYLDGATASSPSGSITFSFSGSGNHTVSLYVSDKDKGISATYMWTYVIAPSKDARVIAMGPYAANGQTDLSDIYREADGLGAGRVWAEGSGSFTKADNFWHYYSFTLQETMPEFFATGYSSGDIDNGSLDDRDRALDNRGSNPNDSKPIASPYTYASPYDSFFYAWVVTSTDDGGGTTGVAYPAPVKGKDVTVRKSILLPTAAEGGSDDGSAEAYPPLVLEAVFSRELYEADNMGDINLDRVPDFFAKKYDLYTLMGGGDGGGEDGEGGGLTTGIDVKKNVASYNEDVKGDAASSGGGEGDSASQGDFLPACYAGNKYSWLPDKAFTAVLEIRGFHEGLNEPGVSDVDISEAERLALEHDFALAQVQGKVPASCSTAEEWMKLGYWSPETQTATAFGNAVVVKRCDPTSQDTDADNLPDGYEYYIWYMAKIGQIDEKGNWTRMTGSRFNPATPGTGVEIPAEVVAHAFNPVVARRDISPDHSIKMTLLSGETYTYNGADFDEDGLSDELEIAIGTNPCSWDTDGDGISDYWEVLYGTDPCDPIDGDRSADWQKSNPDRDFMAWAETADKYDVVTLSDGSAWAFAEGTVDETLVTAGDTAVEATVKVGDEDCYFITMPQFYTGTDGKVRLLMDTTGYQGIKLGETTFASKPIVLPAGTILAAEPAAPDGDVFTATWNEGAKGLPVFKYGNGPYVPAVSNVTEALETEIKVPEATTLAGYEPSVSLTLIHNQVYQMYGFDPRTAWTIDDYGYLGRRWRKNESTAGNNEGATGVATNTAPYTTLDEYLVAGYKAKLGGFTLTKDDFERLTLTTCPSQIYTVTNSLDGSTYDVYGADTDGDGIPDGWELYVGLNPDDEKDAKLMSFDADDLSPVQEYAGVDSCNAYTNLFNSKGEIIYLEVSSIVQNNPGGRGWYNKFFPTDPCDADTDGDGLNDDKEGANWKGGVPNGRGSWGMGVLTFIYGTDDELKDDGSCCIRGGGLNPCTVDTDQDLLPDAWEYEFAGKVIEGEMGTYIDYGMDGTWHKDAYTRCSDGIDDEGASELPDPRTGTIRDYDFDGDGLQNFQEYLVQALRHLRYDDAETPLMGRLPGGDFVGFIPMQTFDGTAFFETCRKAGFNGTSAWKFREIGYFARPPHEWDRLACNVSIDGIASADIANYADYEGAGWRIMLRPQGLSPESTPDEEKRFKASGYCCTDPRRWDTDNDGMDDYYELFHGLNPLYGGGTLNEMTAVDANGNVKDVIGSKYGQILVSFNAWNGWPMMPGIPDFDAIKYPFMMGSADCDADGDGLRNYDEALLVNITSPAATHTDPTPLWMTDSTIANRASYTAQYYDMDPYTTPMCDLSMYPWAWNWNSNIGAADGEMLDVKSKQPKTFMFAFEENEGYDTDRDGQPDGKELTKGVDAASDPILFDDPRRRQAMWFPGDKSAVVSASGTQQRSNSQAYDMLRQFTVECWVKPERVGGGEQIILERVADYGPSTLNHGGNYVRANFRIGLDDEGKIFGEIQGDTENSEVARIVTTAPIEANVWTHLALSYDGSTLALYKNEDTVPVVQATGLGIIPANGVTIILQEATDKAKTTVDSSGVLLSGCQTRPCALIIGARAASGKAIDVVGSNPAWDDAFTSYYAGYVDEVRVWDGARSAMDIVADYNKRYSFDEIKARRSDVYQYWQAGATRNEKASSLRLPPELLQHYNFQTMPGATTETDVALEPAGFTENVLNEVRLNGQPLDLFCGWWDALTTHSTVYRNYNLVPWIQNSVAHLPLMDGSVVDSQYWSENFAGTTVFKSVFPNSANPYPYYYFHGDRVYHYNRLDLAAKTNEVFVGFQRLYTFQLRSDFVGTSDLIPLGGAYAKRAADFWDGNGAMDAWSQTGLDTDGDGIPDWWEMQRGLNIGDAADGETLVDYDGRMIPAWEAYKRDLAKGMLPSGGVDSVYASKADSDGNGLLDWWEQIYGFAGESTHSDNDNDQLSNYAEYLIGECFANANVHGSFKALDPTKMRSWQNEENQLVPDYFLKVGSLYLGEMFTDHDFMEDWWEAGNDVAYTSRYVYDAALDADDDGWSAFAECRYGFWKTFFTADCVEQWVEGTLNQACHPEPALALKTYYHGVKNVEGRPMVVRVSKDVSTIPDAQFVLPGSADTIGNVTGMYLNKKQASPGGNYTLQGGVQTGDEFIGAFREGAVIHGHLNPGNILPGDNVFFQCAELASENVYIWNYDWYWNNGWTAPNYRASGTFAEYREELMRWPRIALENSELEWQIFTRVVSDTTMSYGSVLYVTISTEKTESETNKVVSAQREIGRVNYRTGEYTLDMNALASCLGGTDALKTMVFRVTYNWQLNSFWPQTTYLSKPQSGYIREGRNVVTAFIDLDRNGEWSAGEPYGATVADVGWWETPCEIEMTDTSAQMARYDLSTALAATEGESGASADAEVVSCTDRDVNGYVKSNIPVSNPATEIPPLTSVRLRVVRTMVNGVATPAVVVLDRTFNAEQRPLLTEADILAENQFDLDWNGLGGLSGSANITNVTYRVVVGDGSVANDRITQDLPMEFVNVYERGSQALTTDHTVYSTYKANATHNGIVDAGAPTFSWRHDNGLKDYPAFQLRVFSADGRTIVYDSGVRKAPPRNAEGVYSWTAPLYAGMMTEKGVVLTTQQNYQWSVSMLDAKFTEFNSREPKSTFRLNTTGETTISDYGRLAVKVKYFGPATVSTSALAGLVHVEAYRTPDFSGQPVGAAYVTDVSKLSSVSELAVNAVLVGLPKDGTYYIRAYIDTNGNFKRDYWESWGYANYVGTDNKVVYNPKGYAIDQTAEVYMEDTDVDNDGFPDVYEMEQAGNLDAIGPITGTSVFAKVNPNLAKNIDAYTGLSMASASAVAPVVRLMSAATLSRDTLNAAAKLLSGGVVGQVETDANVTVISFSLEDGIVVAVDASANTGSNLLLVPTVEVACKLLYKASLAEKDWTEIASETVTVKTDGTRQTIDTTKMNAEIKARGEAASGFFKVTVGVKQ